MADENIFLYHALLMGIFISFIYDLLRIFRRVIPHNKFWISLEDLAFWFYCGKEVFLLMYREGNGNLRWFAVLGALTGMFSYKKLVSPYLVKYVSLMLNKVLAFAGKLLRILFKPLLLAGAKGKELWKKIGRRARCRACDLRAKQRYLLRKRKKELTLLLKAVKIKPKE